MAMTNAEIQAFLENLNNHWQNPAWDHETATKILAQVSFVHIPTMINQSAEQVNNARCEVQNFSAEIKTGIAELKTMINDTESFNKIRYEDLMKALNKANRPWWKKILG